MHVLKTNKQKEECFRIGDMKEVGYGEVRVGKVLQLYKSWNSVCLLNSALITFDTYYALDIC